MKGLVLCFFIIDSETFDENMLSRSNTFARWNKDSCVCCNCSNDNVKWKHVGVHCFATHFLWCMIIKFSHFPFIVECIYNFSLQFIKPICNKKKNCVARFCSHYFGRPLRRVLRNVMNNSMPVGPRLSNYVAEKYFWEFLSDSADKVLWCEQHCMNMILTQ